MPSCWHHFINRLISSSTEDQVEQRSAEDSDESLKWEEFSCCLRAFGDISLTRRGEDYCIEELVENTPNHTAGLLAWHVDFDVVNCLHNWLLKRLSVVSDLLMTTRSTQNMGSIWKQPHREKTSCKVDKIGTETLSGTCGAERCHPEHPHLFSRYREYSCRVTCGDICPVGIVRVMPALCINRQLCCQKKYRNSSQDQRLRSDLTKILSPFRFIAVHICTTVYDQ